MPLKYTKLFSIGSEPFVISLKQHIDNEDEFSVSPKVIFKGCQYKDQ